MAKTFALLIGIDAYHGVNPLRGCVNDIDQVERVLGLSGMEVSIDRLAAPREAAAREKAPTGSAITAALTALADGRAGKGDRVFIYYSGHGASVPVRGLNGVVLREALVPVDTYFDDNHVPCGLLFDSNINSLVYAIAQREVNVSVILDACHSAGATRSFRSASAGDQSRRVPIEGTFTPQELNLDSASSIAGAGLLKDLERSRNAIIGARSGDRIAVAAACLADESAMEGVQADGIPSGYFTTALVTQLLAVRKEELSTLRWGRVWPRLVADVQQRQPQHPRLFASFAREIFGGPQAQGDPGIRIIQQQEGYRLEAGTLAGITEGALIGVYDSEPPLLPPVGSAEEVAQRILTLRVTNARPESASAVTASSAPVNPLPDGARARLIQSAGQARLLVALEPPDAELQTAIEEAGTRSPWPEVEAQGAVLSPTFFRFATQGEAARLVLKQCANNDRALTDDIFGTGDDPAIPSLIRTREEAVTLAALVDHYARYAIPVQMSEICHDLPAGALGIQLLDLSDLPLDANGILTVPGMDFQDPQAPALHRSDDGFYDLVAAETRYCVDVRNHSLQRMYVTVVESGNSGRVSVWGGGQMVVESGGRHVFWWNGVLGQVIANDIPDEREVGVDRVCIIASTSQASLDYLATNLSFRDVLNDLRFRDGVSVGNQPDKWTSERLLLRIRRRTRDE
jgi:Caspase domain